MVKTTVCWAPILCQALLKYVYLCVLLDLIVTIIYVTGKHSDYPLCTEEENELQTSQLHSSRNFVNKWWLKERHLVPSKLFAFYTYCLCPKFSILFSLVYIFGFFSCLFCYFHGTHPPVTSWLRRVTCIFYLLHFLSIKYEGKKKKKQLCSVENSRLEIIFL